MRRGPGGGGRAADRARSGPGRGREEAAAAGGRRAAESWPLPLQRGDFIKIARAIVCQFRRGKRLDRCEMKV